MLEHDEPHPVTVEREGGLAEFVLTCDHAGRDIPRRLGRLGLPEHELERHIAWDIGALGVSRCLSEHLDAPLVWQRYSRLVVDCNRPLHSDELIPKRSEATDVPGNADVSAVEREQRISHLHQPYHEAISQVLDRRLLQEKETVLVAIHSFTPIYMEQKRPWHIGVLYGEDDRLAHPALTHLRTDQSICVGDNEPYKIDGKDHTIPAHGLDRGLPHLLFEIRQDLIADAAGQMVWGQRLARLLQHLSGSCRQR